MKKCIEVLLNILFKKDLELLFGAGSKVVVNYCRYSTNSLAFVIDCKLFVTDIELSKDVYPDGLVLLIQESWKFTGINENVGIIHSIDII